MTEHIQKIIEEIRLKSKALHLQLKEEREKNKTFQEEMNKLTDRLQIQKQEEERFLSEIAALKTELETERSQEIEVSHPIGKSDDEIDELVKEIEHCISQLKK